MSLHPQQPSSVPEETHRVAHAAFPNGTHCLCIADALGPIYHDGQFVALFPGRGQPAEAPGRLALATVLQYVEGLSDRQAADAVRGRIDWKYALGLSLTDPGFDHTVPSEFRSRLVEGGAERLLLDALLQRLRDQELVKAGGRQRTERLKGSAFSPVTAKFWTIKFRIGWWMISTKQFTARTARAGNPCSRPRIAGRSARRRLLSQELCPSGSRMILKGSRRETG